MRISYLFILIMFSACTDASDKKIITEDCEIRFSTRQICEYKGVSAKLIMTPLEVDEMSLNSIEIINKHNTQKLNVSPDISLIEGEKGYISFKDINFDGYPDLAITTSFGVANLYLDYWIYDVANKQYVFIGNYSQFNLNKKDKTLSNTVKVSAAEYLNNTYTWSAYKLVKK